MEVLKQIVHIDHSGKVNLAIETGLKDCDAELVVLVNKQGKKIYDFSDIAGKLQFEENPLEYQRRIRSEWE